MGTGAPTVPSDASLWKRVGACTMLFGSIWVALDGPVWVAAAFAITAADVALMDRVVAPWVRSRGRPLGGAATPLVLLGWPGIPAAWVGCAVAVLTGSRLLALIVGVVLGVVLLGHVALLSERRRQAAARGNPVPRKRRAALIRSR